jgi:hypothetical protein
LYKFSEPFRLLNKPKTSSSFEEQVLTLML